MQLGPDAGAGAESQQAYGLAAVPERHHEQSCAAIFARLRGADHRAGAVIDLGLFPWRGENHRPRLCWLRDSVPATQYFSFRSTGSDPLSVSLGYGANTRYSKFPEPRRRWSWSTIVRT